MVDLADLIARVEGASGDMHVSSAEFFATIGQMNVRPRAERECTFWETPSRELLGRSTPGYLGTGESAFYLTDTGRSAILKARQASNTAQQEGARK